MMNASTGIVFFMLLVILNLTDPVEGVSRDDPTVDRKLNTSLAQACLIIPI